MGTTLREIVFDIGGGIVDGRPSRRSRPAARPAAASRPSSSTCPSTTSRSCGIGSFMGSGGMIVMDETRCMVDVAKYFMDFMPRGVVRQVRPVPGRHHPALDAARRITDRRGDLADLDQLERLARMVQRTSLCGLGQGAPNPIFSTLRYFRDEYLAHIVDQVCPAGVCAIGEGRWCRHDRPHAPDRRHRRRRDRGAVDPVGRDRERDRHPDACATSTACPTPARAGCASSRSRARRKLTPACTTAVAEGMEVTTNSEQLVEYRRTITEMLFVERNHVCAVCVANNHCELQDLAEELGVDHFELPVINPTVGIDASHPLFAIDHNRCIMCIRCVRVCDEIEGAHTWDVMGRGIDERVVTDLGTPWGESTTCTSCGKCVQVCPTGALFEKGRSIAEGSKERRPFLPYLADQSSQDGGPAMTQADDSPRSGSTAAPAATCRSSTSTSGCSRSPSEPTSSTARWSTARTTRRTSTSASSRAPCRARRTSTRSGWSASGPRCWSPSATARSPPTCPGCATRSASEPLLERAYVENVTLNRGVPTRGRADAAAEGPAGPRVVDGRRLPARLPAVGRPHLCRARRRCSRDGPPTRAAPASAAEEAAP